LAHAYLWAVLQRSPLLLPSTWFAARVPQVGRLLRAAGPCRCEGLACAHRPYADEPPPAVVVTHELALDWLEQRVPLALVVLDAERLPAAERRRTSVRVDGPRLERLAAPLSPDEPLTAQLARAAEALDDALAPVINTSFDLRARVLGPWLQLRDVLTALRKDVTAWLASRPPNDPDAAPLIALAEDLARLAEPPPPGFETRVHAADRPVLCVEPHHPEAAVLGRLPRSTVLVTGSRGGVAWAGRPTRHVGPAVRPVVELELCAARVGAVAAHAGRLAMQLAGPVNLIVEGSLEPLAAALRESFPRVALRTVPGAAPPPGPCVTLVPWPGPIPSEALVSLVGPVRDVRRAALACGERDVAVLTPSERWAEVSAQLEDLFDDGGLRLREDDGVQDAELW
jgi:hypothetical protein